MSFKKWWSLHYGIPDKAVIKNTIGFGVGLSGFMLILESKSNNIFAVLGVVLFICGGLILSYEINVKKKGAGGG